MSMENFQYNFGSPDVILKNKMRRLVLQPPHFRTTNSDVLDNVDLSRQVRRNFEADFLLTNGGLGPGLHDVSSRSVTCEPVSLISDIILRTSYHNFKSQVRDF